jgi:cysteinyl-tRNA synthetase
MQELNIERARQTRFDLLVTDATSGVVGGVAMTAEDVASLKTKPDGGRRILISYLSIGEAEDYRPDYFTAEYMEEDAPDWLLNENQKWKGNRLIRFCEEGWQRTILGDEDGRNLYNSVEPSPLYKLIELGFDGVYLDRVDVYSEVQKQCPGAAKKMVAFVARLAAHARKKNPNFIVILQNAEELLQDKDMVNAIDAVAKEDLFYGADHSERENDAGMIKTVLSNLAIARAAGRPVLVLDYLKDASKRAADKAKIEAEGFIPYFGPRNLDQLWLSQAGH